jgi:hypothetical protein
MVNVARARKVSGSLDRPGEVREARDEEEAEEAEATPN